MKLSLVYIFTNPTGLTSETLFLFLVEFYVASTQYNSYGNFPALLVEEDLRYVFLHYFMHKRAPE
jgi:hypothetical protein